MNPWTWTKCYCLCTHQFALPLKRGEWWGENCYQGKLGTSPAQSLEEGHLWGSRVTTDSSFPSSMLRRDNCEKFQVLLKGEVMGVLQAPDSPPSHYGKGGACPWKWSSWSAACSNWRRRSRWQFMDRYSDPSSRHIPGYVWLSVQWTFPLGNAPIP